jgi:hypothetical protein
VLLKKELYAMEMYGCYYVVNSHLMKIPSITDKVFVRKKYDFVVGYQHRLLTPVFIKDVIEVPKILIANFRQFSKLAIKSEETLIENMGIF